jgi:hypothetical protein
MKRNRAFLSALKVLCDNLYRFGVEMRPTGLKSGKKQRLTINNKDYD